MTFDYALFLLKKGMPVYRSSWGSKNKFICLSPDISNISNILSSGEIEIGPESCIIVTASDETFISWTPDKTDLLAKDWFKHEI